MKDFFSLIKVALKEIKNNVFRFAIIAILFVVVFSEHKLWILTMYVIALGFDFFRHVWHAGKSKDYYKRFNKLLKQSKWIKENIDHTNVYFAKKDNGYSIVIGEMGYDFHEPWIDNFPDRKNTWLNPVFLQVNGQRIKQLNFIFCDGGRIFIPIPEVEVRNGDRIFYYEKDSLGWRLCQIIGKYYIHEGLERVSEFAGIEIRNN